MLSRCLSHLKNGQISDIPVSYIAAFIALSSAFSLIAAFTAQYGFGLRPCDLCLMQRVPFAINILLGGLAVWKPNLGRPLVSLAGLAFLVNSGIAAYHSGVERKWWTGLSGCSTPDMSGSIEDLLKRIQETDVVRCDEIPWSLFGLSMANYNVFFCLGLGVLCLGFIVLTRRNPAR